jgi:hypothetical protein
MGVLRTRLVAAGVRVYSSVGHCRNVNCELQQVHHQRAYVVGGLRPGAAPVVISLAVVPLPPRFTAQTMTGCRLVGGCEGGCPVAG